jgi:hypothetical protein
LPHFDGANVYSAYAVTAPHFSQRKSNTICLPPGPIAIVGPSLVVHPEQLSEIKVQTNPEKCEPRLRRFDLDGLAHEKLGEEVPDELGSFHADFLNLENSFLASSCVS